MRGAGCWAGRERAAVQEQLPPTPLPRVLGMSAGTGEQTDPETGATLTGTGGARALKSPISDLWGILAAATERHVSSSTSAPPSPSALTEGPGEDTH